MWHLVQGGTDTAVTVAGDKLDPGTRDDAVPFIPPETGFYWRTTLPIPSPKGRQGQLKALALRRPRTHIL